MCFKKSENKKHKRISAETTAAVKDWILFFGDLVKASVEGVVEEGFLSLISVIAMW